jgi:DNA-binding beta-propeller fold protein YncE
MRLLALLLAAAFWLVTPALHGARIVLLVGSEASPLHEPFGAEADKKGNVFIVEMMSGNRLLKLDSHGVLATIAGTGMPGGGGDGGAPLEAQFQGPHNLALLPNGDILIADTWNGRVRRFDRKAGRIVTVPGFGVPEDKARGAGPYCIAVDPAGTHVYIADLLRVHALDLATGTARVVAGNGKKGRPVEGALATDSPLVDPRAVAVDKHGSIYILERGGNALRVVDPAGHIRTLVNVEGKKGATGDDGPAAAATMNGPKFICIDRDDGVLIADAENNLIRKYWPAEKKITRIAGTGVKGSSGLDGDPLNCELNRPHGVSVIPETGDLLITDSYNNRILKLLR